MEPDFSLDSVHQLSKRSWRVRIDAWFGISHAGEFCSKGTTADVAYFNAVMKAKQKLKNEGSE